MSRHNDSQREPGAGPITLAGKSVESLDGLLEGPQPAELALIANYPTSDPISLRRNRRDRKRAVRERQSGR